jgi:transcriptional regulator GlxA family with amidase domain
MPDLVDETAVAVSEPSTVARTRAKEATVRSHVMRAQGRRDAVGRAIAYMHENLDNSRLNLDNVAAAAGLSRYYFTRLFRALTGNTPMRYLTHLRMERAKHILATTDLRTDDVRAKVGFRSRGSFGKRFHDVVGVPPTVHRAHARAEGAEG